MKDDQLLQEAGALNLERPIARRLGTADASPVDHRQERVPAEKLRFMQYVQEVYGSGGGATNLSEQFSSVLTHTSQRPHGTRSRLIMLWTERKVH